MIFQKRIGDEPYRVVVLDALNRFLPYYNTTDQASWARRTQVVDVH